MLNRLVVSALGVMLVVAVATVPSGATSTSGPLRGMWSYSYGGANGGNGVAVADLNGDGTPDAAVAVDFALKVFLGRGDGSFETPVSYSTGFGPWDSLGAGDLDGDGRADVAVAANDRVELFLQTPAGELARQAPVPIEARQIRIADVTSDGRADLVVVGWDGDAVSVFAQTAAGELGPSVAYAVTLDGYNDLEINDVNGDGAADVVAMSGQGEQWTTVLVQQPDGTLAVAGRVRPSGVFITGLGVGDIDGDGLAELVISSQGATDGVSVYDVDALGAVAFKATHETTGGPGAVVVDDLDGDGYGDAAIAHGSSYGTMTVLPGSASGLVPPGQVTGAPLASHVYPDALVSADLNGDGDDELLLAGPHDLWVFGNATKGSLVGVQVAARPTSVRVGSKVTVRLTIANVGSRQASATVALAVPSNLTVTKPPRGCAAEGAGLVCITPAIRGGRTYTIKVVLKSTAVGDGTFVARLVAANPPDDDPTDNEAAAAVTVVPRRH